MAPSDLFEQEFVRLAKRLGLADSDRAAILALYQRVVRPSATADTLVLDRTTGMRAHGGAATQVLDQTGDLPVADEDRYEVIGHIATGGMGEIRRVRDLVLNRTVAMKVLRSDILHADRRRTQFMEEAQATAQLQHPNVVPVHEMGVLPDGEIYFTMKEVRGSTMLQILRELHGASTGGYWRTSVSGWTFRRMVEAFHKACQAVAYAHDRGVVHRDIKPDNIMMGPYGEVQMMDWGLARVVDTDTAEPLDLSVGGAPSRSGRVSGTPSYMSPEQAFAESPTLTSDVYSLGAVLYEIMAGHPPYVAADPRDIVRQLRRGDPPLPLGGSDDNLSFSETRGFTLEEVVPESRRRSRPLPKELVQAAQRAMSREPEQRYADAGELADEIGAWLDGARRSEQALQIVTQANLLFPEAERLRSDAAVFQDQAKSMLAAVPRWAPDDQKEEAWAVQARAEALQNEADLKELDAEGLLRGALNYLPGLPEAHAALANRLRIAHAALERAGDRREASRVEVLLRAHTVALPEDYPARIELADYLRGDGLFSLDTEPSGLTVQLFRYVESGRRLNPVFGNANYRTPIVDATLSMGSYLLIIKGEGGEIRYPVRIERQGRWNAVRPGAKLASPVPFTPTTDRDDILVAGGPTTVGTTETLRDVWVEPFVIRRFPVTNAQYLVFLNDLVATGRASLAVRFEPRERTGDQGGAIYGTDDAGRYRLVADQDGDVWDESWPVIMVDWHSASAYAEWLALRTGLPWRLPSEWEWEKAARGVDGRALPWGEYEEDSWACTLYSHRVRPMPATIDAYPDDESPYGVRGCAGNVMEWCLELADGPLPGPGESVRVAPSPGDDQVYRSIRGGAWTNAMRLSRADIRQSAPAHSRISSLGFRVARSTR